MMFSLAQIIERLEKATGSDMEIDTAIHVSLGRGGTTTPHYTGSIHAAASLVPAGWTLAEFGSSGRGGFVAAVVNADDVFVEARGVTAVTAVAGAALKARTT